jgi:hypothetical protein
MASMETRPWILRIGVVAFVVLVIAAEINPDECSDSFPQRRKQLNCRA